MINNSVYEVPLRKTPIVVGVGPERSGLYGDRCGMRFGERIYEEIFGGMASRLLAFVVASAWVFVSSSESPLPDDSDSELRFAPARRQCSISERVLEHAQFSPEGNGACVLDRGCCGIECQLVIVV